MSGGELIEAALLGLILLGCVVFMYNKARNLFSEQSGGCNCSSHPDGCTVQQPGKPRKKPHANLIPVKKSTS